MKEIINGQRVEFYDEEGNELMYLDFVPSYYLWCFNSSNVITITEDMELYRTLDEFMKQEYEFNDSSLLQNYKDENQLRWYSDCYYNPDDEFSYKDVSYLNIKRINNTFQIWCIKPLDEIISRPEEFHVIGFAPCSNGVYSRNPSTGLTLQDEFILKVYRPLINSKKLAQK